MRRLGMPVGGVFSTLGLAVLAVFGSLLFAGPAAAQSTTEWDAHRPPADATRPAEYRTVTNDTWIRFSPYVGLYNWADDLELEGGISDNTSLVSGFQVEFDPAELMLISFDFGFSGDNLEGPGAADRVVDPDALDDVEGNIIHLGVTIALKDPDLKLGPVQTMLGIGIGAFYFYGYDRSEVRVHDPNNPGGIILAPIDPPFDDTWMFHATLLLRFDVDISERLKVGCDLNFHLPMYAFGDSVGQLPKEEFDFGFNYLVFEPALYLSVVF